MISLCGVYQHDHHEPYAFDVYANAQSHDDATHDQKHVQHNVGDDEHVRLPHAPSYDAHDAYAHGDARGHVDELVLRDVIS
jgi:hypothetical protein